MSMWMLQCQVVHPTQSLATSFDLALSDKNSPKKVTIIGVVIQLLWLSIDSDTHDTINGEIL